MSTQSKFSSAQLVLSYTKRIEGLGMLPPKHAIQIDGVLYTPAEMIPIFQASLDAMAATPPARAEYHRAVEADRGAKEAAGVLDAGLKRSVLAGYGGASKVASDLGYEPREKAVKSVETKGQAVAQNLATRKARGTLGPKAKLKITGVVPAAPVAAATTPTTNGVN